MNDFFRDARLAVRLLLKDLQLSCVVILILALAIGAATSIFAAVHQILLRPLPYRDSDKLAAIWQENPQTTGVRKMTSVPNLKDWRAQSTAFEGMEASLCMVQTLAFRDEPEQALACVVTGGFFPMLGVQPVLGRTFEPQELTPGHDSVALISAGLWRRRFGGSPDVLGRKLQINESPVSIVGVMPDSYRHPDLQGLRTEPAVWTPETLTFDVREADFLMVIGRMLPGVSVGQAAADMTRVSRGLAAEYPQANAGFETRTLPLKDALVGHTRSRLYLLAAAVGLLLLAACVSVAGLLSARSISRQSEFAIRASVGEEPRRLLRELVIEGLLLSLAGGLVGLVVAMWGVEWVSRSAVAFLGTSSAVTIDGRVVAFAFALSLATGILFSVIPAWRVVRADLTENLKAGGQRSVLAVGGKNIRMALVGCQVALCAILLVGAGLLAHSFWRILNVDLGFEVKRLVTIELKLPSGGKEGPRRTQVLSQYLERVGSLPGVEAVGAVAIVPLTGARETELPFQVEGGPAPEHPQAQRAVITVATPGYFQAAGIPLRSGRLFDAGDIAGKPCVVLVNEALARRYFRASSPVGKHLHAGESCQIIGTVADVRQFSPTLEASPQIYSAHAQRPWPSMAVVARVSGDRSQLAAALREELKQVDSSVPISRIQTAEQVFSASIAEQRVVMLVVGAFAAMALLLSCVGVYGVVSYSANQRIPELTIRVALGARPSQVLVLLIREGLRTTVLGLVAGLAVAFSATRFIASQLYEVSPGDPLTFVAVAVVLTGIALIASYLPARRATIADASASLRME